VLCSVCGHENPEGARFCASCGSTLERACPSCGALLPTDAGFCTACGTKLEAVGVDPGPTVAPAAGGERRIVTVLFADLVGFTTLAEHLDPEELRTLMTGTLSELTEEVERRGGSVEKFIGDAIVAVFGAPVAHEDDPDRAVETALSMQEVVRRRSEGTPSPLALRLGINSGLVVAGAVGDGSQTGVMGDAVNVAARLQQAAGVGELLVAASTWRRVRERFEFASAGALEVKGRGQPVEAYCLVGRGGGGPRQRVPFIGRREELALLDLLWSSAAKGNTHVVSVVGDPGVGKSRLLGELRPTGDPLDVRIACGSERAFGPFVELIERILGGDPPKDADELVARAGKLGVEREHALLVGSFLGFGGAPPVVRMADEQRGQQIFNGFWQFVVAVCGRRPALLALDDVHWADESSRDLLDFLLERFSGLPLMLVLCYRPGFERVERAELRASHTVVRLEALSPDESIQLARGFLGADELPEDLERLVAERAEGNPFFIEELLQALQELGSLAVADGIVVLAKVDVEIPDTVQGTVLARVDRLDPRARAVLQHAAVLGRSFPADLLEAVAGNGEVADALDALQRAQLLVMNAPGEWAFKHALIQEVTYETLLLRQRRDLHRAAAVVLEQRAGDDPALLEELAEHYALADAPEQARTYAMAAGDLAAERSGYVEAVRRYETALRVWGEGDDVGRLELMLKLGQAARLAGDFATARTVLIEVVDASLGRGEDQRAGGALALLGRAQWQSGEGERATESLERAIALLGDQPSPELVEAYSWASATQMLRGRYREGRGLAERGLALATELDLAGLRSHLLNTLGVCQLFVGEIDGIDRIEEALRIALEVGEPDAIGRGYINLCDQFVRTGRFREAVEVAEGGRVAMRRLGAPAMEWFIAGNEALALVRLGRYEEADDLTLVMLEEQRSVLGVVGVVNAGMSRIELLVRRGLHSEARALADEILGLARGLGGTEFLGQSLVTEAELELARGNEAAARQALREAVEIAAEEDIGHLVQMLPASSRLLPAETARQLLERARDFPSIPLNDACRVEADAVLRNDRVRFLEAAQLYQEVEMPWEEARCLASSGDEGAAAALYEQLGVPPPRHI
jgi:adenylate cyclase